MYRAITGACEGGVRGVVENNQDKKKDSYTIEELIELTKGQYHSDMFVDFFTKGEDK